MNLRLLKLSDRLISVFLSSLPKKKSNKDQIDRVLVIKLSAMGDALCLMPSIRMFSIAFPAVKIDWLTTSRTAPDLFRPLEFLDNIIVMPTNLFGLIKFIVKYFFTLSKYDLIIDCDQYYQISELLSYFGKSSVGFKTPLKGSSFSFFEFYDETRNEKLQFKALIEKTILLNGGSSNYYEPLLPELIKNFEPSTQLLLAIDNVKLLDREVVVLYPGSSGNAAYRRWSFDNYLRLATELSSKYLIIFAGGTDEVIYKDRLSNETYILDWIDCWTLTEWSWIFRNHAEIFCGNDAGLLHIADLQGLRTVSIFGPNLSSRWGSLNNFSKVIEVPLPCRPCIKPHVGLVPISCHRGDIACLLNINPEDVKNAIVSGLS